jgi:steroid 5-alpha reductase family enzyme
LELALLLCALLALGSYVLSLLTKNYSQVDRLWSIAPPLYVAWFAAQAGFADARLDLMLVLTLAWGARLTWNFARKGGYRRGYEDYRWAALRKKLGSNRFQLLNATFIAPAQNLVLLALTLPAYDALADHSPLGVRDFAAALAFLAFLVGEAIADEQQWRFQLAKREGKDPRPFLDSGLFAYSRHPNFFCEQALWWSFWLFASTPFSLIGPIALMLIFQGSTAFTERLSVEKYPSYEGYQREVSRLIPWRRIKE